MSPKRCQFCDDFHPEGALFCPKTGESLGTPISYCLQCGAEVEPEWNACQECGALQHAPTKLVQPSLTAQVPVQPVYPVQKKKVMWPYWVGGILLVVAVGIIALYMALGLHRKNQIAEIIPEDTALIISVNPSPLQLYQIYKNSENLLDSGAVFAAIPGMVDVGEALVDTLPSNIEIDIQRDILPWVGAEASLAIFYDAVYASIDSEPGFGSSVLAKPIDASSYDGPQVMAVVATRNQRASRDFLDRLRVQLEDEGVDFDLRDYRDVSITEVVSDPDFPLAYATFHHLVVIATDINILMDAIDASQGDSGPVLAEQAGYQDTLGELRGNRLGYVFINWPQVIESFSDLNELDSISFGNLDAIENLGISYSLAENGLRFDYAVQYDLGELTPTQIQAYQQPALNNSLPELTPEDTILYLSGQNLSLLWRSTKEMGQSGDEVFPDVEMPDAATIEDIEQEIETETGVHLTRDIINKLTGEYALAAIPDSGGLFGDEDIPLGFIFFAQVEDKDRLHRSLYDLIKTFAQIADIELNQDEFNNIEVWHLDAGRELEMGSSKTPYSSGVHVTHCEWLLTRMRIHYQKTLHIKTAQSPWQTAAVSFISTQRVPST